MQRLLVPALIGCCLLTTLPSAAGEEGSDWLGTARHDVELHLHPSGLPGELLKPEFAPPPRVAYTPVQARPGLPCDLLAATYVTPPTSSGTRYTVCAVMSRTMQFVVVDTGWTSRNTLEARADAQRVAAELFGFARVRITNRFSEMERGGFHGSARFQGGIRFRKAVFSRNRTAFRLEDGAEYGEWERKGSVFSFYFLPTSDYAKMMPNSTASYQWGLLAGGQPEPPDARNVGVTEGILRFAERSVKLDKASLDHRLSALPFAEGVQPPAQQGWQEIPLAEGPASTAHFSTVGGQHLTAVLSSRYTLLTRHHQWEQRVHFAGDLGQGPIGPASLGAVLITPQEVQGPPTPAKLQTIGPELSIFHTKLPPDAELVQLTADLFKNAQVSLDPEADTRRRTGRIWVRSGTTAPLQGTWEATSRGIFVTFPAGTT